MSKEKILKESTKWENHAEDESQRYSSLKDTTNAIVQYCIAQAYWNSIQLIELNLPEEIPQFEGTRKELENL